MLKSGDTQCHCLERHLDKKYIIINNQEKQNISMEV